MAGAAAIVLLFAPTLSGHALDRSQPRLLVGPGRLRAPGRRCDLARRPALPGLRRAACDPRRADTARGGAAVLGSGARRGGRDRHHGNHASVDRAVGGAPGVVDLLRARPDREDRALRPAPRARLAEPHPAARRVRASAPIGARRAHLARRDRDRGCRAHGAPPRPRRLTCARRNAVTTRCAAAGPATTQRGRRRTRARRPRGRGRADARRSDGDAARPGRHGHLRPERARRGRSRRRLRSGLLPRAGSARAAPRDGERPHVDIPSSRLEHPMHKHSCAQSRSGIAGRRRSSSTSRSPHRRPTCSRLASTSSHPIGSRTRSTEDRRRS